MFDLGKHLKDLRNKKNLTQEQLAKNISSSRRAIQNYEANLRRPTLDIIISMANFYNVSIDYLVGRTDNPKINE